MHQHRPVIADLIRNPEGRRRVAVILALRQYPQGGRVTTRQHQPPIPSPLMGEESKVRVNKTVPPHRHTGFKAVSTGWQGHTGEQANTNHQSHGQPTTAAHVTDCTRNNSPYPTNHTNNHHLQNVSAILTASLLRSLANWNA